MSIYFLDDFAVMHSNASSARTVACVAELKHRMRNADADAALFAVPKYLHGLLNLLDYVLEQVVCPWHDNPLEGKHAAVIGDTEAPTGSTRTQFHFHQTLLDLGMRPVDQTALLICDARHAFGPDGSLLNPALRQQLRAQIAGLVEQQRRSPSLQTAPAPSPATPVFPALQSKAQVAIGNSSSAAAAT